MPKRVLIDNVPGKLQAMRFDGNVYFEMFQAQLAIDLHIRAISLFCFLFSLIWIGVDDGMDFHFPTPHYFTIFIVNRYYGPHRGRTLQSRTVNWLLGLWGNRHGFHSHDGGWIGGCQKEGLKQNQWVLGVAVSYTERRYYCNGKLIGVNKRKAHAPPGYLSLCLHGRYLEKAHADIAEIIMFNKNLSDAERWGIERHLISKYAIKPVARRRGRR